MGLAAHHIGGGARRSAHAGVREGRERRDGRFVPMKLPVLRQLLSDPAARAERRTPPFSLPHRSCRPAHWNFQPVAAGRLATAALRVCPTRRRLVLGVYLMFEV